MSIGDPLDVPWNQGYKWATDNLVNWESPTDSHCNNFILNTSAKDDIEAGHELTLRSVVKYMRPALLTYKSF